MSFRLKTILGTTIFQAFILLVLFYSVFSFLLHANESEFIRRAHITSTLFAETAKDALLAGDLPALTSFANKVMDGPGIVYARILDKGASVLAETGDPEFLNRSFQSDTQLKNVEDGVFDAYADISAAGRRLGKVEIGISTAQVTASYSETQRKMSILGIMVMAFSIVFSIVLGSYPAQGFKKLQKAAERISTGELGCQIEITGNDELAVTCRSFNHMSESMQISTLEIKGQIEKLKEVDKTKSELLKEMSTSKQAMEEKNGILQEGIDERIRMEDELRQIHAQLQGNFEKQNEELVLATLSLEKEILEHKIAEDQMIKAKKEAETANKMKSGFLANMSHEIRTPINGIMGLADLSLETNLDEQQKSYLEMIHAEANVLNNLLNDILDLSKIEAGKMEIEEISFDLGYLFDDFSNIYIYRAEHKGIVFTTEFCQDVPHRFIGDPTKIRQILSNLAENALKFTPEEGEISVSVSLLEENEEKATLLFRVKDTGIGIPEDKQKKIFESFTQADGSTTRKYGGTGLGTTISKQFAEMMGGDITVKSKEGEGSEFSFTVTLQKQKPQDMGPTFAKVDFTGLKVLVVDENQEHREIFHKYFMAWGCKVVSAKSGKEALAILWELEADHENLSLIVTELRLPRMSGFDLAEKIRAKAEYQDIPILVITAFGSRGDGTKCIEKGIKAYLTKPVTQDEIHKVVSMLLKSSGDEESQALITRHTIVEGQVEDSLEGIKILLTEDYPTNQRLALTYLRNSGYTVELAENGLEAVAACKQKHYDLILMDIQMPQMDGITATKAIREFESQKNTAAEGRRVPIIAMTAHAMKGYREKCLHAGMDDYITKPLRKNDLLGMVKKWVEIIRLQGGDNGKTGFQTTNDIVTSSVSISEEPTAENAVQVDSELEDIIPLFFVQLKSDILEIAEALNNKDYDFIKASGHRMKGAGSGYGFQYISEIGLKLEESAAAPSHEDIEDQINSLQEYISNVEITYV